jgi:hypothetical protein
MGRHTSYWALGAVLLCHMGITAALQLRKAALVASGQLLSDGGSFAGKGSAQALGHVLVTPAALKI